MYNLESDPGEFNRKVVFEYLEISSLAFNFHYNKD